MNIAEVARNHGFALADQLDDDFERHLHPSGRELLLHPPTGVWEHRHPLRGNVGSGVGLGPLQQHLQAFGAQTGRGGRPSAAVARTVAAALAGYGDAEASRRRAMRYVQHGGDGDDLARRYRYIDHGRR
jgi:hypothetical protein